MKNSLGPPKHLSAEAKRWWTKLSEEYSIQDDGGLLILQTAFEAFDRMRDAQQQIKKTGATFEDRFGQVKAHPLLATERDARGQFLAAVKQLNLDIEPLNDRPGRPPGSKM
ncbi:MAG TPA: phage terminase small subunit P27 family [Geminicoccus sp.]|uniref:phage terminase small subunit P27 family n=1 Tax=Geminicoccus sp. TaxID=2024832 RepID=UPI002E31D759|nr:phage terminase small subunit P27 family [Geminicoccus sp.]HEX2528533.1 phage terminase small subunit P27 family [Geminicoccus sp.]